MKRYSQENYQRGLWLKYYGNSQIRNMRDKERKDRKRTRDNGKIPWDEETWRRDYVMKQFQERKLFFVHLSI